MLDVKRMERGKRCAIGVHAGAGGEENTIQRSMLAYGNLLVFFLPPLSIPLIPIHLHMPFSGAEHFQTLFHDFLISRDPLILLHPLRYVQSDRSVPTHFVYFLFLPFRSIPVPFFHFNTEFLTPLFHLALTSSSTCLNWALSNVGEIKKGQNEKLLLSLFHAGVCVERERAERERRRRSEGAGRYIGS